MSFEQYSILKHHKDDKIGSPMESPTTFNNNNAETPNELSPTLKVRQTGAQTSYKRQ